MFDKTNTLHRWLLWSYLPTISRKLVSNSSVLLSKASFLQKKKYMSILIHPLWKWLFSENKKLITKTSLLSFPCLLCTQRTLLVFTDLDQTLKDSFLYISLVHPRTEFRGLIFTLKNHKLFKRMIDKGNIFIIFGWLQTFGYFADKFSTISGRQLGTGRTDNENHCYLDTYPRNQYLTWNSITTGNEMNLQQVPYTYTSTLQLFNHK